MGSDIQVLIDKPTTRCVILHYPSTVCANIKQTWRLIPMLSSMRLLIKLLHPISCTKDKVLHTGRSIWFFGQKTTLTHLCTIPRSKVSQSIWKSISMTPHSISSDNCISIDSLLILRLVSIGKTVFLVWRMVSSHKSVATDLAFFTSWWHHDELTDTRRYCTAVSSNTIVICWPCSTASITATFCNTYCLRKWYFTHLVWRFGLCRTAGGWITTTDQ